MYKFDTILYFIFWLIILHRKRVWILISWLFQKLADLDLHCLQENWYLVSYYMYFRRVNCLTTEMYASLFFQKSKIFMEQEHYGQLLVPGQVEHSTSSISLPYSTNISCPENVVCLYSRALQNTLNMLANIMSPISTSTQCAFKFFALFWKRCRSRSAGFPWSQLFRITLFGKHTMNPCAIAPLIYCSAIQERQCIICCLQLLSKTLTCTLQLS